MALQINQLTSQSLSQGVLNIGTASSLSFSKGQISTASGIGNYSFKDSTIEYNFEKDVIYFLKIKIIRPKVDADVSGESIWNNIQDQLINKTVTFKLQNYNGKNEQYISEYTIPFFTSFDSVDQYVIIELIFKPFQNFNRLSLILNRTVADLVNIYISGGTDAGSKIDFDIRETKLIAIQTSVLDADELKKIRKIGVQSNPGLLMCINGEAIRVGPSGIYEIKNGYPINFLSFLLENEQEHFIFDYEKEP